MSREIEFRAVDVNGVLRYGYLSSLRHIDVLHENGDIDCYEIIPETVSQYTGTNDSKGNKIYENDILEINGKHHKVVWSNGSCRYMLDGYSFFVSDLNIERAARYDIVGQNYINEKDENGKWIIEK